jgi:hypothetical protein
MKRAIDNLRKNINNYRRGEWHSPSVMRPNHSPNMNRSPSVMHPNHSPNRKRLPNVGQTNDAPNRKRSPPPSSYDRVYCIVNKNAIKEGERRTPLQYIENPDYIWLCDRFVKMRALKDFALPS